MKPHNYGFYWAKAFSPVGYLVFTLNTDAWVQSNQIDLASFFKHK